jgi:type IV secretion system protein VirB1
MISSFDIMSCPNLAVPVQTMQRVAQVESGYNPFAIGVVGARLQRQPRSRDEAVATARMLEARGYNFSVGIAQVNRANLARYGLDSYEKAFDGCANLAAGSRILAECYDRAGSDWGKAFSCYYSGDFVTGYREGYVQRVNAGLADVAAPFTVYPQVREHPYGSATVGARVSAIRGESSRQTSRPVAEGADAALASTTAPQAGLSRPPFEATQPGNSRAPSSVPPVASAMRSTFVPAVGGPSDPAAITTATAPGVVGPKTPQEVPDAAFVF